MDFLFRIIPLTLIAISIFLIRIYMMNKSTKELFKTWHQEHVVLRFLPFFSGLVFWMSFSFQPAFSLCFSFQTVQKPGGYGRSLYYLYWLDSI